MCVCGGVGGGGGWKAVLTVISRMIGDEVPLYTKICISNIYSEDFVVIPT